MARDAAGSVEFVGRLEHADVASFFAYADAIVMPSTFPEAFGMVAVEAAACGALPLSASHSGLAEVTRQLEPVVEEQVRPLLSFQRGEGAVEEIARKLVDWLTLDEEARGRARQALSEEARSRFGWEGVGKGVIAAAEGRLDELPRPAG